MDNLERAMDAVQISPDHDLASQSDTLTRSPVVWLDGGNCVLQADNMLFKIYSGMLSQHSEVFSKLLEQYQQSNDQYVYQGYPVIQLKDDKAIAVTHFLVALIDLKFFSDVTKIKDTSIVIDVFSLSRKYQVDLLLRRSLVAFTALYPATLMKWENRNQRRQYQPFKDTYGKALSCIAVELATKTGMESILPAAMLECCQYSISEIVTGVQAPNGERFYLGDDKKVAIIQSRSQLIAKAQNIRTSFIDTIVTPELAFKYQQEWYELQNWKRRTDGPDSWMNPFARDWPKEAWKAMDPTRMKRSMAAAVLRDRLNPLWDELPTIFGLAAWDKLQRALIH